MMEEPVNKRMTGSTRWRAKFGSIVVLVWGKTEAQALQAAHEYFKPKKAERHLVSISIM